MRNLVPVAQVEHRLGTAGQPSLLAVALNVEAGHLFVATDDGAISVYDAQPAADVEAEPSSTHAVPVDSPDSRVLAMAASVELEGCAIATSDGALLFLDCRDAAGAELREVGRFDAAVLALAWSPEGDVLAIATASGTLLLMTDLQDVEAEVPIQQRVDASGAATVLAEAADFPPGSVALSWRGDGRYLASVSQADDEHSATLRVWSPGTLGLEHIGDASAQEAKGMLPQVAWQPNGRHIYCGQVVDGAHRVSLFERNGLGHGHLPPVQSADAQIAQLAWSGDSETLAVVLRPKDANSGTWSAQLWQRHNWHWYLKRQHCWPCCTFASALWSDTDASALHVVASIAEDGWRHAQFRFAAVPCVSQHGTAIVIDGRTALVTPLQHALVPPPMAAASLEASSAIVAVAWGDLGSCEVLAAVTAQGSLHVCAAVEASLWEETVEEMLQNADPTEGRPTTLPMGLVDTTQVDLPPGRTIRLMCWVSSDLLLFVVAAASDQQANQAPQDTLLALKMEWPTKPDFAVPVDTPRLVRVDRHAVPGRVLAVAGHARGEAFVHLAGGAVLCVSEAGESASLLHVADMGKLPEDCKVLLAAHRADSPHATTCRHFGLSASGLLYGGSHLIAQHVTSACVRHATANAEAFLLYTVRSNTLHAVPIHQRQPRHGAAVGGPTDASAPQKGEGAVHKQGHYHDMRSAMRPADAQLVATGGSTRAIEAGARLVAAPPGQTTVVLQMPRGNLEGVHFRLFTLERIAHALLQQRFGDALTEAVAARVDLNYLVDFLGTRFPEHARQFVQQASSEGQICDLLTALKPGCCVQAGGKYDFAARGRFEVGVEQARSESKHSSPHASELQPPAGIKPRDGLCEAEATSPGSVLLDNKVRQCCDAIRGPCLARGGLFLRAVIMSHLRNQPADLEAAVAVIRDVKERELAGGAAEGAAEQSADDLTRFLLVHLEPEQAYHAALGLYDLRLAYMLVAASQLDPAEHLVELQALAAVADPHMHRFAIDKKLGRARRALAHAVAAGPAHAATARAFAVRHGLVRQLLQLLKGRGEERAEALATYAQVLEEANKQPDAAVAYLACGRKRDALRCYEVAGEWEMAMALLLQQSPPPAPAAVQKVARGLVDSLQATGRHEDAGTVAATYLKDARAAVQCFVAGGCWRAAYGAISQAGSGALLREVLAPAAAAAAEAHLRELREDAGRVDKYWQRLRQLREKREALAAAVGGPDEAEADELADHLSDVASLASGMSAYTDASTAAVSTSAGGSARSTVGGRGAGRARRARGRKGKIRQGTPEEEQKLCTHVCELAPAATLCTQMSQLNELLILLGHEEDAATLQAALDAYVKGFIAAAQEILEHPPPPASAAAAAEDAARKTVGTMRNKLYELERSVWKWDLLRRDEGDTADDCAADGVGSQTESIQRRV